MFQGKCRIPSPGAAAAASWASAEAWLSGLPRDLPLCAAAGLTALTDIAAGQKRAGTKKPAWNSGRAFSCRKAQGENAQVPNAQVPNVRGPGGTGLNLCPKPAPMRTYGNPAPLERMGTHFRVLLPPPTMNCCAYRRPRQAKPGVRPGAGASHHRAGATSRPESWRRKSQTACSFPWLYPHTAH